MFNKGLKTDEKQEGLLKRLKNIEDKTDNQLRAIEDKDKQFGMKSIGFDFKETHSPAGLRAFNEIAQKEKMIDYAYLRMKTSIKHDYDFRVFSKLKPFFERIYFAEILIPAAEGEQIVFDEMFEKF